MRDRCKIIEALRENVERRETCEVSVQLLPLRPQNVSVRMKICKRSR